MARQGLCASSGKRIATAPGTEKSIVLPRLGIGVKLDIGLVRLGYGETFARSHFHQFGARYHHLNINVIAVRLEAAQLGGLGGIVLNDRENPLIVDFMLSFGKLLQSLCKSQSIAMSSSRPSLVSRYAFQLRYLLPPERRSQRASQPPSTATV